MEIIIFNCIKKNVYINAFIFHICITFHPLKNSNGPKT